MKDLGFHNKSESKPTEPKVGALTTLMSKAIVTSPFNSEANASDVKPSAQKSLDMNSMPPSSLVFPKGNEPLKDNQAIVQVLDHLQFFKNN